MAVHDVQEERTAVSQHLSRLRRPRSVDSGATAVEYGLLVGLIAIVILVAIQAIGTNMSTAFASVANTL
jgi:pilus assembly protein Flp/PilA